MSAVSKHVPWRANSLQVFIPADYLCRQFHWLISGGSLVGMKTCRLLTLRSTWLFTKGLDWWKLCQVWQCRADPDTLSMRCPTMDTVQRTNHGYVDRADTVCQSLPCCQFAPVANCGTPTKKHSAVQKSFPLTADRIIPTANTISWRSAADLTLSTRRGQRRNTFPQLLDEEWSCTSMKRKSWQRCLLTPSLCRYNVVPGCAGHN